MPQPFEPQRSFKDSAPERIDHPPELQFVPTNVNDKPGGGWYRELPDGQIEVMSRAHLECVPIENGDAETTARIVVEKLIKQTSI